MTNERDAEGDVEGREPHYQSSGGISYATLSYAAVTALSAGIAVLLWQVWINTGRITALEVSYEQHDKIDLERGATLNTRILALENRTERENTRVEAVMGRLEVRIDAVSSMCEALSRKVK